MKTLVCKTIFMILVLFVLNARADSQIEFRLVQKFMVVVSVTLNDAEKFDFLLDTGTNSTIVMSEVAQKLNLRPRDRIEMMTVAGNQIVPRAFLQSAALGLNSAKNLEVLVADLPAIRAIDKKICGILGQNFLAQFNYLLDYEKRRIVFEENNELENSLRGRQIPVENEENRLLMTLDIKNNLRRFLLDSGTANLIIFGDAKIIRSEMSFANFSTDTGSGAAQTVRLNFLRIGDETASNLQLIIDDEKNEPRTENGLLPLCLFRAVYFNHKKGFVIFNPREKKTPPTSVADVNKQ